MTKEDISRWENCIGSKILNPMEFFDGQRDCIEGRKHRAGMGYDYDRGYNAQYTHTENLNNLRWKNENRARD